MTSFFLSDGTDDPIYAGLRDDPEWIDEKEYVERLWTWYKPLADTNCLTDAQKHLHERYWEMYCAKSFDNADIRPKSAGNAGPDFYFDHNKLKVWVEATAPGAGESEDAVPTIKTVSEAGMASRVPEREFLLRMRGAIEAKQEQWNKWITRGVVEAENGFIIALCGGRMRPGGPPESTPPLIVKAVFPIGNLLAVWDPKSGRVIDSYHERRDAISKSSGNTVQTDIFLSPKYQNVSAVMYSRIDCFNHPEVEGTDTILVHNPTALVKLPLGLLKLGREFWVGNDGQLSEHNWNIG